MNTRKSSRETWVLYNWTWRQSCECWNTNEQKVYWILRDLIKYGNLINTWCLYKSALWMLNDDNYMWAEKSNEKYFNEHKQKRNDCLEFKLKFVPFVRKYIFINLVFHFLCNSINKEKLCLYTIFCIVSICKCHLEFTGVWAS